MLSHPTTNGEFPAACLQELKDLQNKLVKKVDTGSQFVYYQVTRGTGIRDHAFTEGPGNLWVMLKPATISDGIEPIKLITEPDTRFFHCNIKTLNLIPSVMGSFQPHVCRKPRGPTIRAALPQHHPTSASGPGILPFRDRG